MAALTLFIVRNSLAPAEHALIWGLALAVSVLQFALIAIDVQAHPEIYGGLPASFLGLAAAALYAEGFRQRSVDRASPLPLLLVSAVAAAALVGLAAIAPASSLRSGVVPIARAALLVMAIPMVLPRTRASSYSEWAVATMLLTLALCDVALAGLAAGEYLGLVTPHAYVTLLVLMIAPRAAALGLFALLLIASDFSAQRRRLIRTDPLTGVLNRLGFEHAVRAVRRGHPVSVAIADIDHFKAINDHWGHGAGDLALGRFARHLATGLRGSEAIGRIGGEEFALLLAEPAPAACERIERLRDALSALRIEGYPALRLAASFGIAQRGRGEPMTSVIARADDAMYRAKHGGRNRTLMADPAPRVA